MMFKKYGIEIQNNKLTWVFGIATILSLFLTIFYVDREYLHSSIKIAIIISIFLLFMLVVIKINREIKLLKDLFLFWIFYLLALNIYIGIDYFCNIKFLFSTVGNTKSFNYIRLHPILVCGLLISLIIIVISTYRQRNCFKDILRKCKDSLS